MIQPHSKRARYLLRFDDICPTMNWTMWSEIEASLIERDLKPILAVVPDNQDPVLKVEPAVQDFWSRVRGWQARGWTIALHGYRHQYVTVHRGIVTVKNKSEFAGIPAAEQEEKLRRGMDIFKRNGVSSSVWIAPRNSFDAVTVTLLPGVGINIICDGNFRFPFETRSNMFWVPQQLFRFRPALRGVWTVCYHHNGWTSADLRQFRLDLDNYGPEICSLEDIIKEWTGRHSRWSCFLCESPRLSPLLIRGQLKLLSWWKSLVTCMESPLRRFSSFQTK